jgi:hypothetical protein
MAMSGKEIIEAYDLRWGVEVCFRQVKDTFYFDHFQLHTIPHIERYWFLVLMAWTIAYCCKQMGLLTKVVKVEGSTIAAHADALRRLIQFTSQRKMSKNNSDVQYYGIISQRAETRAA